METPNRTCTYSLGDNGTTATVSPSGRLLRISQHFPGEKVGYCVDHPSIPEPYDVVNRITTFVSSADDPDHNIGFFPVIEWMENSFDSVPATFIDNRWPVFTIDGHNGQFKIHYYISHGVVYQSFHFDGCPPQMSLRADLLIRQLEFVEYNNQFNRAGKDDEGYHTELLSSGGYHLKRWHDTDDHNKHIALFISAHMGNSALPFKKIVQSSEVNRCEMYSIDWPDNMKSGPTEITFAYSLELSNDDSIKSPQKTVNIPIPWNLFEKQVPQDPFFTGLPPLNRLLSRNLEYILSVCSIPVYAETNDDSNPAIALTCGDIDGHRVATASSFYCFQLLLMALKYFESLPTHSTGKCASFETCYICIMVQRIRKVLNGHLKWIFGKEYRDLSGNARCTHTWVNDKEIAGSENNPYFPTSLVDVPFQLIKAGDFYEYEKSFKANQNTKEARIVPETAAEAIKAWIKGLDNYCVKFYYIKSYSINYKLFSFFFRTFFF